MVVVFVLVLYGRAIPPVVRNDFYASPFVMVAVVETLELTQLGNALASRSFPVHDHDALTGIGIDIEPRAVVSRWDVVDRVIRERRMVVADFQRDHRPDGGGY